MLDVHDIGQFFIPWSFKMMQIYTSYTQLLILAKYEGTKSYAFRFEKLQYKLHDKTFNFPCSLLVIDCITDHHFFPLLYVPFGVISMANQEGVGPLGPDPPPPPPGHKMSPAIYSGQNLIKMSWVHSWAVTSRREDFLLLLLLLVTVLPPPPMQESWVDHWVIFTSDMTRI